MKLPYPKSWDVTPVTISLTDGTITQQGVPSVLGTYDGMCNYSEKSITVRQADGSYTRMSGAVIHIGRDISPTIATLSGSVEINDRVMLIVSASRPRNPDGSVHHTKLELV